MNDPLAKYRTKAANAPVSFAAPAGPDEYSAFGAKDRVERLKIKCANQPTRAPGYNNLLEIVYDGGYGRKRAREFSHYETGSAGLSRQGHRQQAELPFEDVPKITPPDVK